MEWSSNLVLAFLVIVSAPLIRALVETLRRGKASDEKPKRVPPGPQGWPIIGNLLDLGAQPHQTLAAMRKKYGDVVFLRFGQSSHTMVVLSCKAATELFKNHDLSFSDRDVNETLRAREFDQSSLAFARHGPYWRTLKRLLTTHMLSVKRLNETAPVRRKYVDDMLRWMEEDATRKELKGESSNEGVQLAHFIFLMMSNLTSNFTFSKNLIDPDSRQASELSDAVDGIQKCISKPNVADFFPWLRPLDPQGLKRKMEESLDRALRVTSKSVYERLEEKKGEDKCDDFLDVLLAYRGKGKDEPEKLSTKNIATFLLELFIDNVETTSTIAEWVLTEIFRHPEVMEKVKAELDRVVGPDRKVEESDMENLHYLQAVIKESMRLHPPVPLLLPRKAVNDTTFMGYHIPKDTKVMVNVWAIGRDEDIWSDPLSFKPERFLGDYSHIDYKGQDYELIPFGAGRRICPGMVLGHRVLHVAIGSMIHEFDWELKQPIDMKESFRMALHKDNPLAAVPKRHRFFSTAR